MRALKKRVDILAHRLNIADFPTCAMFILPDKQKEYDEYKQHVESYTKQNPGTPEPFVLLVERFQENGN
jgi:hypothetical protein